MKVVLYVVPGSHPAWTARLMLEHKGIAYRRVDLVQVAHKAIVKLMGFPGATVPALAVDDRKVTGSREIARLLEELRPEPPLFPAAIRPQVEEAERWGEEVLQPIPRRLVWWAMRRDSSAAKSFLAGSRLPVPSFAVAPSLPLVAILSSRINGATDEAVREDLRRVPEHLDRVDGWIAEGTLDGVSLNAADFQIATSLRLLMCFDDLRGALERRPGGALALRVAPEYPGRIGPVFPVGWLPKEAVVPDGAADP